MTPAARQNGIQVHSTHDENTVVGLGPPRDRHARSRPVAAPCARRLATCPRSRRRPTKSSTHRIRPATGKPWEDPRRCGRLGRSPSIRAATVGPGPFEETATNHVENVPRAWTQYVQFSIAGPSQSTINPRVDWNRVLLICVPLPHENELAGIIHTLRLGCALRLGYDPAVRGPAWKVVDNRSPWSV